MSTPIRAGLLGIDHAHGLDLLRVLRSLPEYELVGVCEPDAAVRAEYEQHPALKEVPWLSGDALLGDASVQMIAVESFPSRSLPLAQQVVDAGKHLHLDKPAGVDLAGFRKVLDTAEEKSLLVQMGYMFRYNAGFDFIREAHAKGWLGEIYSIHASMCTDLSADKRERIAFHPGGAMLELGCHLIDMVVLLLGEPDEVTPILQHNGNFDDGLADNTLATFRYNHALVTIEIGAMEPEAFRGRRFKVCGHEGSATLSPLEPPALKLALRRDQGGYKKGVQDPLVEDRDRHRHDLQDLALCIRGEKAFAYPKAHDLAVQRTVLRASGVSV